MITNTIIRTDSYYPLLAIPLILGVQKYNFLRIRKVKIYIS